VGGGGEIARGSSLNDNRNLGVADFLFPFYQFADSE
jgi:hypothetical protein